MRDFAQLVRVGSLYPFIEVLREAGCPVDKHLERCRLVRQVYEREAEEFVPFACVLNFLERTALNEGIEDLGLRAGSRITVGDLGEFGLTVGHQPTVFSAFRCAAQWVAQHNTSVREWMAREEEGVRHFRRFRVSSEVGLRHADHFSVAMALNTIRAWTNWHPGEVSFQGSAPLGFDLESRLEVRAIFNQSASSMLVPRWVLARSIKQGSLKKPDLSVSDPTPLHWIDGLRSIVEALLYEDCVDIRTTAEAAGTSVRSLQRSLLAEGYTYSSLVDQVRFTTAASLLRDPHAKMIDIALDLGYQNPGSFSRAFKRWSGCSPREFRSVRLGTELETDTPWQESGLPYRSA